MAQYKLDLEQFWNGGISWPVGKLEHDIFSCATLLNRAHIIFS